MLLITGITDEPKQRHRITLPNGEELVLRLEFKPLQTGWFMSMTYQNFQANGLRIAGSPNMLNQYRNLIPFGMACYVTANQEPMFPGDFLSQRAKLYILTEDEVDAVTDYLNSG